MTTKARTRVRGGRRPHPPAPPHTFRDHADIDATLAKIDAALADYANAPPPPDGGDVVAVEYRVQWRTHRHDPRSGTRIYDAHSEDCQTLEEATALERRVRNHFQFHDLVTIPIRVYLNPDTTPAGRAA